MAEIHTSQAACHENTSQERLSSGVSARASSLIRQLQAAYGSKQPNFKHFIFLFPTLNKFLLDGLFSKLKWDRTTRKNYANLAGSSKHPLYLDSTLQWECLGSNLLLQSGQVNCTYISGPIWELKARCICWWHGLGTIKWEQKRNTGKRGGSSLCKGWFAEGLGKGQISSCFFPIWLCVRWQVGYIWLCLAVLSGQADNLSCAQHFLWVPSSACFHSSCPVNKAKDKTYLVLTTAFPFIIPCWLWFFHWLPHKWRKSHWFSNICCQSGTTHYLLSLLLLFLFFSPHTLPWPWVSAHSSGPWQAQYMLEIIADCHKPCV